MQLADRVQGMPSASSAPVNRARMSSDRFEKRPPTVLGAREGYDRPAAGVAKLAIRAGFRCPCSKERVGSSPTARTKYRPATRAQPRFAKYRWPPAGTCPSPAFSSGASTFIRSLKRSFGSIATTQVNNVWSPSGSTM